MQQFNPNNQHNPPGFNRPHVPNPRFPSPQTLNLNNNFHPTNPAAAPPRPSGFPNAPHPPHPGFPPQHTQFPPHQALAAAAALQLLLQQNMQFPGQHNQLGQMQNNPAAVLLQSAGTHNAALQNNLAALMQSAAGVLGTHNGPPNINQNAALQNNLAASLMQSAGVLGVNNGLSNINQNAALQNSLAAALMQSAGLLGADGNFNQSGGLQMGQLGPQNMTANTNQAPSFQGPLQQHPQNQTMSGNPASSFQCRPLQPLQHPSNSTNPQFGSQNPTMNGNQAPPFQGPQQQQHSASSTLSQNQMINANVASPFQCRPSHTTSSTHPQLCPQNPMINGSQVSTFQCTEQKQQQHSASSVHSHNQMMNANVASHFQCRPLHTTISTHPQLRPQNPMTNGSQVSPFQCTKENKQQEQPTSTMHSQNQMMNANVASPFQCRFSHTTSSTHPQLRPQNPMMNGSQVSPFQCTEQKEQQQQPTITMHSQFCPPNGNQAPPFQHSQQQQRPTSSTNSFNVPPYAQPGSASNGQMIPANSNLISGNGTVPNGGMQWNNQDLSELAASANNDQSAPIAAQISQPLIPNFPVNAHQAWMNMQLNGLLRPQVNHIADRGNFVSNVIPGKQISKNFTGNSHRYGKTPNSRVQNQTRNVRSAKNNVGPTKNDRKGQQKPKERNLLKDSIQKPRLVPKYTEKEITLWREARKRCWPTKAIIMKKLATTKNVAGQGGKGRFARKGRRNLEDEDAILRRQQLKEVLAQQAELGVEVAEIPERYLAETTNRIKHPKKSKTGDGASASQVIEAKRSPTLLQKLLNSEIIRDKSRLLQVFRFMVLNSFFEQWPDKLLEFPVVTVEDTNEETPKDDIHTDANVSNGDVPLDGKDDKKEYEKPEEGEITD